MPTFNTGNLGAFQIPTTQLAPIVQKVQDQSILASLAQEEPTLYGNVQSVSMTRKPRAQIVAEGAQKASDTAAWESVTANPVKIQTTWRTTQEVLWLDEDYRLTIVDSLTNALGESISRAVDLIGIHGINPQDGTQAASITKWLNQTTKRVPAAGDEDGEINAAYGQVIADGTFIPDGVGMDPRYAFAAATQRNAETGALLNPDLGFDGSGGLKGLSVARSTTVSGQPEAADTRLRALVGDFASGVRWGFQRNLPVELIEYGDPDGGGDLKNRNEIAYRVEAVLYVAIFDLNAFAAIETPAAAA